MTTQQALDAGVTRDQLRSLRRSGWTHPSRGVWVCPEPVDPFRASARAALLGSSHGVLGGRTAVRVHDLWGLPLWTPDEKPAVLFPAGRTYHRRTGVERHAGLAVEESTEVAGFPVTTIDRTIGDVAGQLPFDDLVCLLDSARRAGWVPDEGFARRSNALQRAFALSDPRSESPLETLLRLLLTRAGLPPEELQWQDFGPDGRIYARVDIAWPSLKVAIEADGRRYHDDPEPLYRDRTRANALEIEGWTVLRFTWFDLRHRPEWVVAQVRRALNAQRGVNRAS